MKRSPLFRRQNRRKLPRLRRKKLSVPLKAIQTDRNIVFTSRELYRELCAEREAIARGTTQHQG